jgi:hypothetical protein
LFFETLPNVRWRLWVIQPFRHDGDVAKSIQFAGTVFAARKVFLYRGPRIGR